MKINNNKIQKLAQKAINYAYEHDLAVNNYVPTDIEVSGNNVDVLCINEYGGRYGVCYIQNVANKVFTYRELKALTK